MSQTQLIIQKVIRVMKALFVAYTITAGCLFLLALLLLKLDLNEGQVHIGVIITYLLSSFLGGFLLGKIMEKHKFLWGILLGITYFILTLLITAILYKHITLDTSQLLTNLLICIGGGMAGGMLS